MGVKSEDCPLPVFQELLAFHPGSCHISEAPGESSYSLLVGLCVASPAWLFVSCPFSLCAVVMPVFFFVSSQHILYTEEYNV